ncbi:RDD family protein, partial [Flavobacterium sp. 3-210]
MTPEQIATKPNLKKRILAGLIDYSIILGVTLVMFLYFGKKTETGYELQDFPALLNWLIWFGYMVGFEVK